jgi:hypothetical protein
MRQGSEISFVQLGAYIGTAHTVTVNSLNETINQSINQSGLADPQLIESTQRACEA